MMSMSGGWFFVVAAEAISVGKLQIALPGVGSYVARAIEERNLACVGWAILAMSVAIFLYDQLLFRPLVAWSEKFRFEQTAAQLSPRSWVLSLFQQSAIFQSISRVAAAGLQRVGDARLLPGPRAPLARHPPSQHDAVWMLTIAAAIGCVGWGSLRYARDTLSWSDLSQAAGSGLLTLLRVLVLVALASVIWVPIGVIVGLRPRLSATVQPIAQFLAAFPANLLFPLAVFAIVTFQLAPAVWLSPLMILGTQWYILFNVIAGASAFPSDLREAAASFRVRSPHWWGQVILPGIFPYFVTGAITASGGAWNASVVSEAVNWGSTTLNGGGLGAYITQMTRAGDYPRIALGVAVMAVYVVAMNRLLWRPLYAFAERRSRLD
jgi:NitT/TauT family transport system permease protein